jgi:hypothetical protein
MIESSVVFLGQVRAGDSWSGREMGTLGELVEGGLVGAGRGT